MNINSKYIANCSKYVVSKNREIFLNFTNLEFTLIRKIWISFYLSLLDKAIANLDIRIRISNIIVIL